MVVEEREGKRDGSIVAAVVLLHRDDMSDRKKRLIKTYLLSQVAGGKRGAWMTGKGCVLVVALDDDEGEERCTQR